VSKKSPPTRVARKWKFSSVTEELKNHGIPEKGMQKTEEPYIFKGR
jgi:hypothetical protein